MPEEENNRLQDFNEMEMSMEEVGEYDPWRTSILSDDPSIYEERVASTRSSFHSTNEGGIEELLKEEEEKSDFDECMPDPRQNPRQNPLVQKEIQSWSILNAKSWSKHTIQMMIV